MKTTIPLAHLKHNMVNSADRHERAHATPRDNEHEGKEPTTINVERAIKGRSRGQSDVAT